MGNKRNKCCCDKCPNICISHGQSLGPCGRDVALFYSIGGLQCGPFAEQCCPPPAVWLERGSECVWTRTEDCGEWSLSITADSAEVRLVYGSYVIIWKPATIFDPLCTTLFVLDTEHPDYDAPTDCGICQKLCVSPHNACCDNQQDRDTPMPSTLYGTFTYCCGLDADQVVEFQLHWDPTIGRWVGETEVLCAGSTFAFEVYCTGFIYSGCGGIEGGGDAGRYYWAKLTYGGISEEQPWTIGCNCNPFEAIFNFQSMIIGNCAAEAISGGVLTVTE